MLNENQSSFIARQVRTMQVIVGALAAGVVAFLTIALAISSGDGSEAFLTYLACGAALLSIVFWLTIPNVIVRQARQAISEGRHELPVQMQVRENVGDVGPLVGVYQVRLITGSALLEGAAFFNLIAYLHEGNNLSIVTTAALLSVMLSQFPTAGRVEVWVRHELENIEQLAMKRRP